MTSRGDRQEDIYLTDQDRADFLTILGRAQQDYNWLIHAYCLMDNHYHLLIEAPDSNLSQGMRQLNDTYAQAANRNHERVGHGFQGRYKAIIVQKQSYLLELARYIVLNPIRARMVRSAKDWPQNSYRQIAGLGGGYPWLTSHWLLAAFGKRRTSAQSKYREFVAQGKSQPSPWESLSNQVILGTQQYAEAIIKKIDAERDLSEIPMSQRRARAKPLFWYGQRTNTRDEAIAQSYLCQWWLQPERHW